MYNVVEKKFEPYFSKIINKLKLISLLVDYSNYLFVQDVFQWNDLLEVDSVVIYLLSL